MTYLEMEAMQQKKKRKPSEVLKFFYGEFDRISDVAKIAKKLNEVERRELTDKLIKGEESLVSIVSAQNEQ